MLNIQLERSAPLHVPPEEGRRRSRLFDESALVQQKKRGTRTLSKIHLKTRKIRNLEPEALLLLDPPNSISITMMNPCWNHRRWLLLGLFLVLVAWVAPSEGIQIMKSIKILEVLKF